MPRFITKALVLQIKTIDNSSFLHRNAKIKEQSFFLLTASSSPIWYSVCSDWTHIPLEAGTHANSCYSCDPNTTNNIFLNCNFVPLGCLLFLCLNLEVTSLVYFKYLFLFFSLPRFHDEFNYTRQIRSTSSKISICRVYMWVTLNIVALHYRRFYFQELHN